MTEKNFDVIVVGAGPGGSSAARELAANDLRVLIIDKSHFPREKPCGNFISDRARKNLKLQIPKEIIQGSCRGVRYELPGKKSITVRLPFSLGLHVYRSDFDWFLLQKAIEAGADTLLGEGIQTIHQDKDGVEVRMKSGTCFTAEVLIGADGAAGITWKLVRKRKFRRFELGIGISTMCPPTRLTDVDLEDELVIFDISSFPNSYIWLFPQGGLHNIGIYVPAQRLKRPHARLLASLDRCHQNTTSCQFKSHPVSFGGFPRRIANKRAILVGDAAGLVDILTGEGISNAIVSGQLGAQAAITTLRKNAPETTAKIYTQLVKRYLLKDLRASLLCYLALTLFRPLFFGLRNEFLALIFERLSEVVAGRLNYWQFVTKSFRTVPLLSLRSLFAPRNRS